MRRAPLLLLGILLASSAIAAQPKSGFFRTSDGVRLHYLDAGSGPAMVFVPGWTMPAEIWQPQIEHFSKNYRVVALEPRSQGESDKPAEGHDPARRARDIKELVDHLKLQNTVLVGWSMGVHELLTYAEQSGTAGVRAFVLVDGVLWDKWEPHMAASIYGWMQGLQQDRRQSTAEFVKSMYKRPQTPEYLAKITAASLKTPTNTAVTLIFNMTGRDTWALPLAKLDRPVMYAYTPQLNDSAALVKKHVPAARLELFETAGHALFVDEAERFNRVLEDFIRSLK